jgi:apolipoprotein N-acyltransferase
MLKRYDIILAIISGLLLIPGFPPFDLYPVAWFAIVPLLYSLRGKNVRTSFFLGTLTGFIYFFGTIYWVFNSIYYYGNIPAAAGLLLMLALCLYLGLYLGVFPRSSVHFRRNQDSRLSLQSLFSGLRWSFCAHTH